MSYDIKITSHSFHVKVMVFEFQAVYILYIKKILTKTMPVYLDNAYISMSA